MSTDKDWEKWGAENPYYGVLSDPKYLGNELRAEDVAREFQESGVGDIDHVMSRIALLGGGPRFKHAVDFGCGVGRLTVPLAAHATRVTGVDVSPSILDEARKKLSKQQRKTITYAVSDDTLTVLPSMYDLVHSYIVLQHIPPARGEQLIEKLLGGLEKGGFAALHITFAYEAPAFKKLVVYARNRFLPLHYLLNVLKGHSWNTPRMRMHLYDLGTVARIFDRAGVSQALYTTTDHGGYVGAMIIGRKQ